MGIAERDYSRRDAQPPGGGFGGGWRAVPSPRLWSINTWIIVVCVAVFAVDGLMPQAAWKPVPVGYNPDQIVLSNKLYRTAPHPDPEKMPYPDVPYRVSVYDAETGQVAGEVRFQRMPPLKRWLFFSTYKGFFNFEFWRLIGFQFLHADLLHLFVNMLGLYFFGPMVERKLGSKRYLAFYLLCGICGALMYLLLNTAGFVVTLMSAQETVIPGLLFNDVTTTLIGASAGAFGVLMAGAFIAPRETVHFFFLIPMQIRTLAYGLVVLAFVKVFFGTANAGGEAGHLGGAIAGYYFIRHTHHLHGFFDFLGRVDPTSHHYRQRARRSDAPSDAEIDRILDKIKAKGMNSLTKRERRTLAAGSDDSR